MDVLRGIITEDMAYNIPMDIFKGVASVSSTIVIRRINQYLSDKSGNVAVQRRVEEAYSEVVDKNCYYTSNELINAAKEISSLTYADISANQTIEQLEDWKSKIKDILNSPYAVAYIPPVKISSLLELLRIIDERAESTDNEDLFILSGNMYSNKTLFKDAPFKGYKGTPVKRIINDRTKYDTILKGLDFLISRKKAGMNPQTWRFM